MGNEATNCHFQGDRRLTDWPYEFDQPLKISSLLANHKMLACFPSEHQIKYFRHGQFH